MGFSHFRHWLFMAVTICHLQPITDIGCQEQSVTARNSRRPAQGVKHIENDGGQCLSLTVIDDRKAVSQAASQTFRGGLPHWGTVGKTLGTRRNACGNGWERKQRGGRRKILPARIGPERRRLFGQRKARSRNGKTMAFWRCGRRGSGMPERGASGDGSRAGSVRNGGRARPFFGACVRKGLRERGAGAERKGGISNARGGRAKSMPRSVGIRTGAQGGGWPGDQGRARPFPRLRGFPYRATCTGNIRAFPEPAVSMPALRAGRTGARLRF